jgi:hypothetical protein
MTVEPLKQQLVDLGVEESQADRAMALGDGRFKEWLKKLLPVFIDLFLSEQQKQPQ